MLSAANKITRTRAPAPWATCTVGGVKMRQVNVPFTGVAGSWQSNLDAALPRTHPKASVWEYSNHFDKPAAPVSGMVTLLLGYDTWEMRCAREASEFAKPHHIWPASPYHVFEAVKHLDGFNTQPWWDGYKGPGIIIPKKSKIKDEVVCLWYRNPSDTGGAQVRSFGESLGTCMSAFVTYDWKSQRKLWSWLRA